MASQVLVHPWPNKMLDQPWSHKYSANHGLIRWLTTIGMIKSFANHDLIGSRLSLASLSAWLTITLHVLDHFFPHKVLGQL